MLKKLNFDNTIKKVETVSDKINIIMRNRLIIAIFLIIDGITFMLNPNGSLSEMARSIIILVLLASFSTLITNLSTKTKDRKSIITSIVILLIGIVLYIYPDLVSAYMQLILSLFIIFDGIMNILNTSNINKLSGYSKDIIKKYKNISNNKKSNKDLNKKTEDVIFKDVNKNVNEGIEQQKEKLITPLKNIVNKTNKSSLLYIVINIASIILGITLIIFPDVSMAVWGIIFLYTGLSDLLIFMKTMKVSKKVKGN